MVEPQEQLDIPSLTEPQNESNVSDRMWDGARIEPQIGSWIGSRNGSGIGSWIRSWIGSRIVSGIRSQIEFRIESRIGFRIGSPIGSRIGPWIGSCMGSQIGCQISSRIGSIGFGSVLRLNLKLGLGDSATTFNWRYFSWVTQYSTKSWQQYTVQLKDATFLHVVYIVWKNTNTNRKDLWTFSTGARTLNSWYPSLWCNRLLIFAFVPFEFEDFHLFSFITSLYFSYSIVLAWLTPLFDTWDTWHSFSLCHLSARQTQARIICRIFLRQLCKNWPWLTIAKDVCPILWKLWSLTIWLCNCCKTFSHNWKAL